LWYYKGNEVTTEFVETCCVKYVGFVYLITNLSNNKKYLGQKKLWGTKTKQIDKKPKKIKCQSDWQKYYGSSQDLKDDVVKFGKDKFKREILRFCETKSLMNYVELREQMLNDVILKDDYYNSFVGTKIHRKHLKNIKF
jgi:hypothetical protein